MNKELIIENLFSLEEYDNKRNAFRKEILTHKKNRKVTIGKHVSILFENYKTIQYQIQEMLRIEKIFEKKNIQSELDSYNPLIPNGNNWKATMFIEYPDPEQRRKALSLLVGIEDKVWVKISNYKEIYAIADEDMDRTRSGKTSAVHFLRFELSSDLIKSLNHSVPIIFGIDHENYQHNTGDLAEAIKTSIIKDLD